MRILVIIPARSGSKRFKNKNSKTFVAGKNLIDITYELAKKINAKNKVDIIISTDIESVKKKYKLDNLNQDVYQRPDFLNGDDTTSDEVIYDVIKWCDKRKKEYDICILLQVTSPLRTEVGINKLIAEISNNNLNNSYISISKTMYKTSDLIIEVKQKNIFRKIKKNEEIWFEDGAYYVTKYSWLLNHGKIRDDSSLRYIICEDLNQIDIDYEEDFITARELYKKRKIRCELQ
jgi:CMP-N,N'-diacetyllegionaminic acid synthase